MPNEPTPTDKPMRFHGCTDESWRELFKHVPREPFRHVYALWDARRKLLAALAGLPATSAPATVIRAARVKRQIGLEALRGLQYEGLYRGFKR